MWPILNLFCTDKVATEPFLRNDGMAKENIEINNFSNKISLYLVVAKLKFLNSKVSYNQSVGA
jgi:hypothetical protein